MKIAIVGAGAAGMMAMATLVESGISGGNILLFEGNERMGCKVAITGGGRCNVTTAIIRKKDLLPKYIRGAEFLEASLGLFSPKKCREWFESHGIPLKEEDNFRLFPVSDDGWDIVAPFEKIARDAGVETHFREKVTSIEKVANSFQISTSKNTYEVDICLLTTGGNAYAKTGSNGDGYAFARALGHTITPLGPSLSSFITGESWGHAISGLVLPSAELSVQIGESTKRATGGFLFTHFGISGPCTFALSAHLAHEKIANTEPKTVFLNADSTKTRELWEASILDIFTKHPTRSVRNILSELVPRRYAEVLANMSKISEKTATTVGRDERKNLVRMLSQMPLTLLERRSGDEFVTAGWVLTEELNPNTMESLKVPGLYFAGEILNIDAVTGGFNLQGCWATGYTAGKAIITKMT